MGIPSGSQCDPTFLFYQSAPLFGDELPDPMYKAATETLNITCAVDVLMLGSFNALKVKGEQDCAG